MKETDKTRHPNQDKTAKCKEKIEETQEIKFTNFRIISKDSICYQNQTYRSKDVQLSPRCCCFQMNLP